MSTIPFGILPHFEPMPPVIHTDIADWGARFISSKYGRPFRYKNRAARTNDRTGNKKKIHQYLKK